MLTAAKKHPRIFTANQAFFPKNRGHWKQFSSWEPEEKSKREKKTVEDTRFPPDIEVKKGYSWSDQLGIAIASLVESGQEEFVHWTKDVIVLGLHFRLVPNYLADFKPRCHAPEKDY